MDKLLSTPFQKIISSAIVFLFFMAAGANAQKTATVRGFVYDNATGEAVLFTNVYLKGTSIGAATDVNGYYSISKVPPGKYVLTVTSVEFDTLDLCA